MRFRRGRWAALLLWVAATLGPAGAAHADDDADLRAVYCLSAAHREQVVEAAVNLRLGAAVHGEPGSLKVGRWTYPLRAWRDQHPDDFGRACDALLATVPQLVTDEKPGALPPFVELLLPVLAGALLTLAVQRVDAAVTRRQASRDALLQAAGHFRRAAHEYVTAWIDNPRTPGDAVSARAFELQVELAKHKVSGRHRAEAAKLADDLPVPYDVAPGGTGGTGLNHAQRREAGEQELRRVATLVARAESLVRRGARGREAGA
ncbi:hypothetical protein ABGB17_32900 [Sphaerisporangium sp. B11E5]|uniref:hypothetical protein n=1 Tax=Sphaerisporangium sp. B11E5 TaxID=3153563 RepID=UPI00325F3B21